MTYTETLHYLYTSTPTYHLTGANAYKPGLERCELLDQLTDHPHRSFKSIHVAGTNGKGSVAHLLAAVLREAKYKVGLYTSPHLVDFCERIRVNGRKISKQYVVGFVEKQLANIDKVKPSFFEITSCLAFEYFRHKKVDVAIIETGLGGRLDSTNIISPIVSVITNVSLDHTQFLGKTVTAIANEKAGIIKPNVPVVVGDSDSNEVLDVFKQYAKSVDAPIFVAGEEQRFLKATVKRSSGKWDFKSPEFGNFTGELPGIYQKQNAKTVLATLHLLKQLHFKISSDAVAEGFENVTNLTGLMGRWQIVQHRPKVVCDIGHNVGAWEFITKQLTDKQPRFAELRLIVGFSDDKDINGIIQLLPKNATYYFTNAGSCRALAADALARKARTAGLNGKSFPTVEKAIIAARKNASPIDTIFVGGSAFVVAEALPMFVDDTLLG
jgi:dihydrofolate synthase/folylpolyglutamate synthase